jgi:O-antigen/teichoic acid export membrane protein
VLGVDIIGAVAALAAGLFITTLLALRPLLKKVKQLTVNHNKSAASASQFKPILRYSLPIMVGIAFSVSASKSDFIILGYLVADSDVGLYAAAFQTAAIMSIILQSVESVIAPYISEAISKNSVENLKEVYQLSLRWVYILGAPLYLFFMLFPDELLAFFGEQFVTAALCFSLLATGQFINIATGSANYMLLMQGKTKWVMVNSIINGSMQVGLNIYLIPQYGIIGAAVSMIAATTLINVLRLIEVYVLLKIHPYSLSLIMPTLIALLTYGAVFLLKQEIALNIQFVLAPATFIIYFGFLLLFGLTISEKTMLYAAISKLKK